MSFALYVALLALVGWSVTTLMTVSWLKRLSERSHEYRTEIYDTSALVDDLCRRVRALERGDGGKP